MGVEGWDRRILDLYKLLDVAFDHHLIDEGTAYDAFAYDLEKALQDSKVRNFLTESRAEKCDLYDGVLELARAWKLEFPPLSAGAPATGASSQTPTP